ncbi:MAG: 30S ribosomal protein S6e [Candidatus Altiarchaeota archaeon]
MEYKVVIGDPSTGKSYQREIKEDKAKRLVNKSIGEEFEGELVGLTGYTLQVTGGADKTGTPMKKGIPGSNRSHILSGEGTGCHPKRKNRIRKLIAGERISEETIQVNTKITKAGRKNLEALLGISTEKAEEEGEKPADESDEKEAKKAKQEAVKEDKKEENKKEEKPLKEEEKAEPKGSEPAEKNKKDSQEIGKKLTSEDSKKKEAKKEPSKKPKEEA